jgi:hypothetical protein
MGRTKVPSRRLGGWVAFKGDRDNRDGSEIWSCQPVSEVTEIRQAYHDATELLVRLANVLENGLLNSARKDGATAVGLVGWLLSGLNERVRISESVKIVFAFTVWLEEDMSSRAIRDGACALRMGAQLVNTLFTGSGAAFLTETMARKRFAWPPIF